MTDTTGGRRPKAVDEYATWYEECRPQYEALARTVEGLLREVLTFREIDFLAVTSRAKSIESFQGKIQRKRYDDARKEVTDLCGIRVITYLEADVARVSEVIRDTFQVDAQRSLNKSDALAIDRVGYRSLHFICTLGPRRAKLPEYEPFSGLVFEIQVRTVLQHAWAQIEHDRNYKFGGVLPTLLQRRLFLAAGLLETADREFGDIAAEIDNYARLVSQQAAKGELDIEITSQSLLAYMKSRTEDLRISSHELMFDTDIQQTIIGELRTFGIETLRQLDDLVSEDLIAAIKKHPGLPQSDLGALRDMMMFHDLKKYFEVAWQNHWNVVEADNLRLLTEKYASADLKRILRDHDIMVL